MDARTMISVDGVNKWTPATVHFRLEEDTQYLCISVVDVHR